MTQHESSAAIADCAGVVTIGRNEGDRLRRSLESVRQTVRHIVYVDSGSTDDSVATSQALHVKVVELDMSTPFTAARARNEGFRQLLQEGPSLRYVVFVDGDCEVAAGWIETAVSFLDQHPDVAIAWGRRRERYPEKSVYNLLCDLEWAAAGFGETTTCGGDIVIRVEALRRVGGYRPDMICGEEPELCVRLRQTGWRIWHLQHEMTLHDAALHSFGQWWTRMRRGGFGFAQGAFLHGAPPERHWVAESRRIWIWGLGIPAVTLLAAAVWGRWALWLLAAYPLQIVRLALTGTHSTRHNWIRAVALVVGKFPEVLGQIRFTLDRWRHTQSGLIEYK